MLDSVIVLVNPTAAGGRGARAGIRTVGALRAAGVSATLLMGRDASQAEDLARAALQGGARALVVVGGDGTVHLGTQLVAGTDTALGVVGAGTGNDFARTLGLPAADYRRGARALVEAVLSGHTRQVDAVRTSVGWFTCVLSAGFDSVVNERANRMRWPSGRLRYDVAMLRELPGFRPVHFTIELSGEAGREGARRLRGEAGHEAVRRVEREAMLVAVGNTPSYGGGMRICPAAGVEDGLLDVTLVGPMGVPTLLRLFPLVFSGRHVNHPSVTTYRARSVALAAAHVTAYADGERLGALPLRAEVVPGALRVLVPPHL